MADEISNLKMKLKELRNENEHLKKDIEELEAYKDKLVLELENVVGY